VDNSLERNAGSLAKAEAGRSSRRIRTIQNTFSNYWSSGLSAQNMCEKISNSSNTIQDFKTQGLNKIYTTTNQLRQTRDQ
jgi:hypothetical protein